MSHDFPTPLNAIIGFSEVLPQEMIGPIQDLRQREYLSRIKESGQHIRSLISYILDVPAAEAGKNYLHRSKSSLNAIVSTAIRLVQPRADAGGEKLLNLIREKDMEINGLSRSLEA